MGAVEEDSPQEAEADNQRDVAEEEEESGFPKGEVAYHQGIPSLQLNRVVVLVMVVDQMMRQMLSTFPGAVEDRN